jgi:hypothetical protein
MTEKNHVVSGKPQTAIRIESRPDETDGQIHARVVTNPTTNAATTVYMYHCLKDGADVNDIHRQIEKQALSVNGGSMDRVEAMLVAQAHTLDVMFNMLAQRAAKNLGSGYLEATEAYLRLALKAQSQSRSTLQTLSDVKNPRTATFIKQANIAEQQQVNNGHAPAEQYARTREKDITPTNELLEHQHAERLDFGAPAAASGADQVMATVGAVNRAQDRAG